MGPEARIERAVCEHAAGLGWLVYKWTAPGNRAVPDRLFMRAGRLVLVEFKAPGKRPTKLQARTHARIAVVGGFPVHVVDNVADGRAVFDRLGAL